MSATAGDVPMAEIIGIEIPERYDGVSVWWHTRCGTRWDRWTEEIVEEASDETD